MDKSWQETIVKASRPVRWAAAVALSVLALFLLVATIDGMHNWGHEDTYGPDTITVSGEGMATAIPDTATISFTAQATANDVATAEKNMTDPVNAALSGVKSAGISDSDITTTNYNVSPHYSYQNPGCPAGTVYCPSNSVVSGYDVSETVQVKIHDTTKVATVLGSLAKANVQNVSGPNLEVGNPQQVMQQARAQAILKAQQDAQVLAKQLGVRLGKIQSFEDNTNNNPTPMFKAMGGVAEASAAVTPSVPLGQSEYNDTVSITYEIH